MSVSPSTIAQGDSATLTWSSTESTSASLDQGIGSVATSGSQTVSPTATTTYNLTVSGAGGTANCSAMLEVQPSASDYDLAVSVHVDDENVPPNQPSIPTYTDLVYDINYQNIGDLTMTDIVITEDYDETQLLILTSPGVTSDDGDVLTWNIASLASGETGTFTYEVRLQDSVTSGDAITDDVYIQSLTTGMLPADEVSMANNASEVTVNVSEIHRGSERKRVTNLNTGITSTAVQALEGQELEYVLSYTAGDTDEVGIMIVDDDPNFESIFRYADLTDSGTGTPADADGDGVYDSITFGPFDITAYQTQEVRFRVRIKDDLEGIGGDYTLRNSYGNDVTVVSLPNLSYGKTVSVDGDTPTQNDSAEPGSVLEYTLTTTNSGNADKNGFVFEDDITDILEYATVTDYNGGTVETNAAGEQIIHWPAVTIPANASVSQSFTVTVDNPLIAGGDYTLRNVYGNAVTVVTLPDITIAKSVLNNDTGESGISISADEGQTLVYSLTATNNGTVDQAGYIFEDDVSDVLEYVQNNQVVNISNGGVLNGTMVEYPSTNLAAGVTLTRTFEAVVDSAANWPTGTGYDLTLTNVYGNQVDVTLPGVVQAPDLHIEKSVVAEIASTPPSGAPGTDVSYTIEYRNEGNLQATVTQITDDYDEVNLTNIRNLSVPSGVTWTDDGNQIEFSVGNLPVGSGGTITYEATIAATAVAAQDIVNTVEILSAEVDADATDNQSSALLQVAILQITMTKTASTNSVGNAQSVDYTITVNNNEATLQTMTLTDTFGTFTGGVINGTNGGSITYQTGTQNITFVGGGSASGDIGTSAGVVLTDVEPGTSVIIVYEGLASNSLVPTNGTSDVTNTATLFQSGAVVTSASQTVVVYGPSGGGSSSSSSSSSSGGGGGGGGSVYKTSDLSLQKMISLNGVDFLDANTAATSLLLENKKNNIVTYKVVVTNQTSIRLKDLQIEDTYYSQNSRITQFVLRNVKGATYADGVFTVDTVDKDSQVSFTYQATLDTNLALQNSSAYNEAKVLDYERDSTTKGTKKTGQTDKAYVIVPPEESEEFTLIRKYSNRSMINDGDEVIYTIILKNVYDYDLRNVVITDDYDEAHLEILNAPGVNDGSTLKFRRTIVRPGENILFRYTAKGQNKGQNPVQATNYVRIFSDTADLSNEVAQRTVTINPFGAPKRLAKTGNGGVVWILISLTGAYWIVRRRKRIM